YCRSDADGVCGAQAFVNRTTAAIVAERQTQDDDDVLGQFHDEMQVVLDAEESKITVVGQNEDGEDDDVVVIKDGHVSATAADNDVDVDDDDDDDFGAVSAVDEYDHDGVVGGTLSQWSLSAMSECVFASGDESDLDCLEVDLDDM
ncbi:hypothetical protein LPJ66_012294, partial [Kickxella alabastrina]